MRLPGFGQDLTFYVLLEQQAGAAVEAAQEFHALTLDYGRYEEHGRKIDEIEHRADELTHELANRIDSTFVTPLDKEDLHALSNSLDDITDAVEDVAGMFALYRFPELRADVPPLAVLLLDIMRATRDAVAALRHLKGREAVHPLLVRIHELENQADNTYRRALSELFHAPDRDPFLFIAWKEVYDRLEVAIDRCEDVANTVESVMVKYA